MKKWTSFLAVLIAVLMVATSAFAQAGGAGTTGPAGGAAGSSTGSSAGAGAPAGTPAPGTSGGDTSSPAASPATGTTASADFSGRHTMEGEVTRIDQKKGHVTLKTAEGNMDLHFPPSALQNVKKGDRISVELAMKPAGQAGVKSDKDAKGAASPKTDTKSDKKY